MPFRRQDRYAAGFTLLEILLVLVLMGLAATMVMPRLSIGSNAQDLRIASERLLTLAQVAQQMSFVEGRSIGLSVTQDKTSQAFNYDFLALHKGEWVAFGQHPMLRKVALPPELSIQLKPGDSFWKEALDYEDSSDSLLETVVTEARVKPDIYFWSSGEITPARIQICLGKSKQCREIVFEETGEITDRELVEG